MLLLQALASGAMTRGESAYDLEARAGLVWIVAQVEEIKTLLRQLGGGK